MPSFAARAGAWLIVVVVLALLVSVPRASAFCGFYVGKADASLFNEASQVILVLRYGKTVIPEGPGWEMCEKVLSRRDVVERLSSGW